MSILKRLLHLARVRIFEKNIRLQWSGMNEITNKWGKQIRMQYIGVMLIDSITEILFSFI